MSRLSNCLGKWCAAVLGGGFACFFLLGGCGEEDYTGRLEVGGQALAAVGDREIDSQELNHFEETIQPVHRSLKTGLEGHREHLLSLIDVKLMVLEAEERGLHQDPALQQKLGRVRRQAMIEAYLRLTVGQNIALTEQELRDSFASHPARHAVRGGRILLGTRQEAEEVYAEIQGGRSFEELARERSLDRVTGERGGHFERFYTYDQVSDQVFARVFEREVGEVLEPFRTQHGWEVVKVVESKPLDFETYRPIIQYATLMQKFERLKEEHIAALERERNLRLDEENMGLFLDAWNRSPGQPELTEEQLAAPLFRFAGEELTLEMARNILFNAGAGEARIDSALLVQRVRRLGLLDLLLEAAAREAGYAEHPEVQGKVAEAREHWLLKALWEELLEAGVRVSEEEAREHYEENPQFYKAPAEIVVQEILVRTREQAEELREQIAGGADIGELAIAHSIRQHASQYAGLYGLRAFERMVYGEFMEAAQQATPGEVVGPVRIVKPLRSTLAAREDLDEAFSIFKVLERLPERPKTFAESRELASFYARQQKQRRRLQELNLELRRKFRDRWGINEQALREYAEAAAQSR